MLKEQELSFLVMEMSRMQILLSVSSSIVNFIVGVRMLKGRPVCWSGADPD
jgi:hypothetical protein